MVRVRHFDRFLDGRIAGPFALDFAVIVDDSGVIAASQGSADLFVAAAGQFASKVDRNGRGQ